MRFLLVAMALGGMAWLRRQSAPALAANAVKPIARSLTVLASIAEIEFFLLDSPAPGLRISLRRAPGAGGTEVHARLDHWHGSRDEADSSVRTWLRRMKQLIETGEVARVDERIRGVRA